MPFRPLMLSAVLLLPGAVCLANDPTIALEPAVACGPASVTATALPPRTELTVATGTTGQNGLMFDVDAKADARITGFRISPTQPGATFELYVRSGSHVGHEESVDGWTLLDTVSDVPTGSPLVDPGFNVYLDILAGQTLAFYITTSGDDALSYGVGVSVGATLIEDDFLTVRQGVGKVYPFGRPLPPGRCVAP